jgi:DNA-binding MarR family transcriptional regulator
VHTSVSIEEEVPPAVTIEHRAEPTELTGRPLSDRQYESLAEFRYALRLFLRFSEQAARVAGLTPAQHQLLLAVRGWRGSSSPSIGDLAVRLQSTPHATLELVRRVEHDGLVHVENDPDDRRRQVVTLSSRGHVRLEALTALHRDELRRFRREMTALLEEI